MENKVWENNEEKIEVWIEDDGVHGERLYLYNKKSTLIQSFYLEDAIAIHHAVAYFRNIGVIK